MVLAVEEKATTVDLRLCAVALFDSKGISYGRILSDNVSAYCYKP